MNTEPATATRRALLERAIAEIPANASSDQLDALVELSGLVARWAPRLNLTGHRTADEIQARLVLDALALTAVLPEAATLADLGSGAGFPGLPIAILRPQCTITLVEAREKRHHFQRAALRALGLTNVRLRHGRAEALATEPHDAVVAQAIARPEQAIRWMLPWARPGAWLLIPSSENLPGVPEIAGVIAESPRCYRVPLGGPSRTLWVGRRAEP